MKILAEHVLVDTTNFNGRKRRRENGFEMELSPHVKVKACTCHSEQEPDISKKAEEYKESYSLLELLPLNLMWNVIEYVPESVFQLRSTSRILRNRVDSYALQHGTIPLVSELKFKGSHRYLSPMLDVNLYVPKNKADLFELRLKLRNDRTVALAKIIERTHHVITDHPNVYKFKLDTMVDDADSWWSVREAMGRRIEKVSMKQCETLEALLMIFSLMEGIIVEKMKVVVHDLTDFAAKHLMETVIVSQIDQLFLSVRKVSTPDPVGLLLQLSSVVRSIHINQSEKKFGIDHSRRILFGMEDIDWAPIFIAMLSLKLDKLCIENFVYPLYLGVDCADLLRERLPHLNENVWFSTTCYVYPNGMEYKINDHFIQANNNALRFLRIRHLTREKEKFEY